MAGAQQIRDGESTPCSRTPGRGREHWLSGLLIWYIYAFLNLRFSYQQNRGKSDCLSVTRRKLNATPGVPRAAMTTPEISRPGRCRQPHGTRQEVEAEASSTVPDARESCEPRMRSFGEHVTQTRSSFALCHICFSWTIRLRASCSDHAYLFIYFLPLNASACTS